MQKTDLVADKGRRTRLVASLQQIRQRTEELAEPISSEDAQIQSMPDASPTKWHLGHTSWFFETFLLRDIMGETPHDPSYEVLFNSYYNTVGEQHPRANRGLLSRPGLDEVMDYRRAVTARSTAAIESMSESDLERATGVLTVGFHHEQQHQELLLTDILHAYWSNPLRPPYSETPPPLSRASQLGWDSFEEGLYWIGHDGESFAFDNEYPRHREFIEGFQIASRPATVREFLEFMESGGYREPEHWLSDGWHTVQTAGWEAPMYWERRDDGWYWMTLHGMLPVDPDAPVCQISYYEADAFARWSGARLPTEAEWEVAAQDTKVSGRFQENDIFVPVLGENDETPSSADRSDRSDMYGNVWEWTKSAYLGYPGYHATEGALGEYNGKFMCNQFVLKGGSVATPASHVRLSYRNFFPPGARWQYMGLRLARDL